MNQHKQIFPPLTHTVADKDGMRVEWTETGQRVLEHIFSFTPSLFALPFENSTSPEWHWEED